MPEYINPQYASYSIYVDWGNTGDFNGTYDDITSYVQEFTCSRGFNGPPPAHATAGTCMITLKNGDGRFSSFNTSSPIFGDIVPNRRVRITMSVDSGEQILWTGLLRWIQVKTAEGNPEGNVAILNAVGPLSLFTNGAKSIDFQENRKTGQLLGDIFDIENFSDYDITEQGQSTLAQYWNDDRKPQIENIFDLQDTEMGQIFENAAGQIIHHDRAHHFTAPYDTPRAMYGTGTLSMWDLEQLDPAAGIYNSITIPSWAYDHGEESTLVVVSDYRTGKGGTPYKVPASSSIVVKVRLPAESNYVSVYDWTTVYYEANTQADGSGTDNTEFVSPSRTESPWELTLTFSNSDSSDAYLILLIADGIGVTKRSTSIKYEDSTSIGKYGRREYPYASKWETDPGNAASLGNYIVDFYKDPRPRVSFRIYGNVDNAHLNEVIDLEINDRIHITAGADYGLYIDEDFIVDRITHTVKENIHITDIVCTIEPAFILGSAAQYPATNYPFSPDSIPVDSEENPAVPADLVTYAMQTSEGVMVGARAKLYNENITEAQLKYVIVSSDTTVPDYYDLMNERSDSPFGESVITVDLDAGIHGVTYSIIGSAGGLQENDTVFYAFKFKNDQGWSLWTDGNTNPTRVTDKIMMEDESLQDAGPPSDWNVIIENGPVEGTVQLRASRPNVYGRRILFAFFQIIDTTGGSFTDIDADTGAAETYYDGSTDSHTVDSGLIRITKDSSAVGFGDVTAGLDVMVLISHEPGSYDVQHTSPVSVARWENNDPENATWFEVKSPMWWLIPGSDYRIKIIKAPWNFKTNGYFGAAGWRSLEYYEVHNPDGTIGDMDSNEFVSPPIYIGSSETSDLSGRAFFANSYSWSDDRQYSENEISDPDILSATPDVSSSLFEAEFELDASVVIDKSLIRLYFSEDSLLKNIINSYDGQFFRFCLVNTSSQEIIVTLDDKYRSGKAFPYEVSAVAESGEVNGLDILEEEESA